MYTFSLGVVTIRCAFILICIGSVICVTDRPVVETKSGPVEGNAVTFSGTEIHTFFGIPYAKPPVGNLRFERTKPVDPWSHLDASEMAPACPQIPPNKYPGTDTFSPQSEDCLHLNIWVPSTPTKGKAVMLFFFGGFFQFGSTRLPEYDGRALAAVGDVIVITPNFRQGVLAFFSSGTQDAPGNLALYDCLEALRWVHNNIEAFGGDPNSITLAGEASGAVYITLLSISPAANKLYKRAILQSSALALPRFFYDNGKKNLFLSQVTAEALDCSNHTFTLRENAKKIVECMRGLSAERIVKAASKVVPVPYIDISFFLPSYKDELFPEDPIEAVFNGHFHKNELLTGVNRDEGALPLVVALPEIFGIYGHKKTVFDKDVVETILKKLSPKFLNFLKVFVGIGEEQQLIDIRRLAYTLYEDITLMCPTAYYAQAYAKFKNNVYFYFFDHRPNNTVWAPWMGVTHFEEIQFVFGLPLLYPDKYTEDEYKLSSRMVHAWTSFVNNGYPGENWNLYSEEDPKMRELNTSPKITDKEGPHTKECAALKKLF